MQYRGTAGVARFFAPVTALWFVIIAAMGIAHIVHDPAILLAFNPAAGLVILAKHPGLALLILGGVFLAVTGGEALYADMGHFGKIADPPRLVWRWCFPDWSLNYLGQGALDPCRSGRHLQSLLPDGAGLGAHPPRRAWRPW